MGSGNECHELCTNIADKFQYEYEWLDVLADKQIRLEDKFIDVLNNGYLIRLLKRLECLDEGER